MGFDVFLKFVGFFLVGAHFRGVGLDFELLEFAFEFGDVVGELWGLEGERAVLGFFFGGWW